MAQPNAPKVPNVPLPSNMEDAVKALVSAASFLHHFLLNVMDAASNQEEPREAVKQLAVQNYESIAQCDQVLERWRDHFGMDVEDILADV